MIPNKLHEGHTEGSLAQFTDHKITNQKSWTSRFHFSYQSMESTVFLCKENCGKKVSDETAWKWQKGRKVESFIMHFKSLFIFQRSWNWKSQEKWVMKSWVSIINLVFFSRHAQPLGHRTQIIIYWIYFMIHEQQKWLITYPENVPVRPSYLGQSLLQSFALIFGFILDLLCLGIYLQFFWSMFVMTRSDLEH